MKHLLDPSTLKCRVCGTDWPRSPEGCPGAPPAAKPQMRVVPMREPPPLTDTAAWLESIARDIRAGKLAGHVAVVVLADEEGRIDPRLYGRTERAAHTVGLLKMAADYVSRISTRIIPDADDDSPAPRNPAA